jgi:hypothetical protein
VDGRAGLWTTGYDAAAAGVELDEPELGELDEDSDLLVDDESDFDSVFVSDLIDPLPDDRLSVR